MMKQIPDIRFYDFQFRPLHTENQFISANWNIYYNGIGNFEAHFDLASDTLPMVMENDYIIAAQGANAAIIIGKNLGDDLTVYGRTCNWLMKKRVTDAFAENGDKLLFELVSEKIKEAFPEPSVVLGSTVPTSAISAERKDKCETFTVIQQLLAQEQLGHELRFDAPNARFVFQVLKGCDNPLVISTANRNAYDVTVNCELLNILTHGLYKEKDEEGNDIWREIAEQPPKTGLSKWVGIVSGAGEAEAEAALKEAQQIGSIQGKTIGLHFGIDYSLGDTVTLQYQAGDFRYSARKRITGVNLWYESGNIGEEPVFEDLEETI